MSNLKLTGHRCQCRACGEYFSRERVFDRHRIGAHGVNRRCLTVTEMVARGWCRNTAGFWILTLLDGAGVRRIRSSHNVPISSSLPSPKTPNSPEPAGLP
jgi:hypothetical protein